MGAPVSPSRGISRWVSRAPRRIKARFALPMGDASQAEDLRCKSVGIYWLMVVLFIDLYWKLYENMVL